MAETADRDANRALRARFDDVFGQYQRLRSGLDDLQRRLAEMQVSAESDDGLITATVGSRGQLIDLRLDRRVYRDMDPEQLEPGRSSRPSARPTARTTDEVQELMADYLPPDSGAMRFLRDNDFGSLLRRPGRRSCASLGTAMSDGRLYLDAKVALDGARNLSRRRPALPAQPLAHRPVASPPSPAAAVGHGRHRAGSFENNYRPIEQQVFAGLGAARANTSRGSATRRRPAWPTTRVPTRSPRCG